MTSLSHRLKKSVPTIKIKDSLVDRHAFACDASFYYLLPQVVVQPSTNEEIKLLFQFAGKENIPLTFRTAGTSLSGQAVTDGMLVDLSTAWNRAEIIENGLMIRVGPAVIGARANQMLKKFRRKIGPDPASINAAMMGGIIANNSSGMCCGVIHNAYHTMKSIGFILPDGNEYNTALNTDYSNFEENNGTLFKKINQLKHRVRSNTELTAKVKYKYRIKNTVGYSINAFLDFEHPLDILAHLLIGSEGTLAFITEVVLSTIPDKAYKKTGILFFADPIAAAANIFALKSTHPEALELMDRAALASIENIPYCPAIIKSLPPNATAVLCEYQADSPEELERLFTNALETISELETIGTTGFTDEEQTRTHYWKLRKGIYPSVAAIRKKGTSAILEDVAVPVEHLGDAVIDLQKLFREYTYDDAIIFGHAKEGNLHFLITQPVNRNEEIAAFEKFSDALADIIIKKYNGSLKAEHGSGRQIAPYIKDEWGEEVYEIMKELKKAVDPLNILNPGVIINDDPKCHVKNLKTMPVVEEEVDKCVECGYCESTCPSKGFTLSPRQRIQVRRSLQRLQHQKNEGDYINLLKEYKFAGIDTCAVDGLCALECPVAINTGDLIKRLRHENHSSIANKMALMTAKNFSKLEYVLTLGLHIGFAVNRFTNGKGMVLATKGVKKIFRNFPIWLSSMSQPVKVKSQFFDNADFIYFSSCITRMMGGDRVSDKSLPDVISSLCTKAGYRIDIIENSGFCCGQVFSSKGFYNAYSFTINKTIEYLWNVSKQGKMPIITDVTSCVSSIQGCESYLTVENKILFSKLSFLDSIDFIEIWLLPKLTVKGKKKKVVIHPVCSSYKTNLIQLKKIALACADEVILPLSSNCCGMAGDRGFYFPELNENAIKEEFEEINSHKADGYYSSGKTCEMALSHVTGKNYQSIFYLIDDCTSSNHDY